MVNEVGVTLDKIIITGGGSNSDLFMQIFADVFNLPAVRNVVNGAAGLGSATGVGSRHRCTEALKKVEGMVKIPGYICSKSSRM